MQISQSFQSKIDFQDNKQSIQYYEYLRSITQTKQISYWIGNPSVQIISGKVLLEPLNPIQINKQPENYDLYLKEILKTNRYAENKKKKLQIQLSPNKKQQHGFSQNQTQFQDPKLTQKQIKSRCLILCGISNSKSPVQVMQTQSISRCSHLIKQIRIIKTTHIKYYGMLLLMKNQQAAAQFFNQLFGQLYHDLENDRIILRQISRISLSFSELNIDEGANNQMILLRSIKEETEYIAPQNIFMTYHHQKLKENNSPKHSHNRQLMCAICFQQCSKLAISILCGHYFDLQCLEKWSQNICPLCRYHQQPPIIKFCQKCNQCEGLWVCLICGSRLCCGVNNNILGQDSHIYDHFKKTSHSLSMQLQTKFLFDAKIPAFLHQKFYRDLMISNNNSHKISQKIVMQQKNQQQINKKDKITQQIQQYQHQVSQQMKRQRTYFQEQINKVIKNHRQVLSTKRAIVQNLRQEIQINQKQQLQNQKQIKQLEESNDKKTKELQIVKNLIKMKQNKVKEKKEQMKLNQNKKIIRLKQLEAEIKEKKQEILNYRKNLKLRQRFSQKLHGEEIKGEVFMLQGPERGNKNNKKTKKQSKK